ncbi:MAG TPA: sulfatase-like hydrolase/transferase [Acetobacteraceae bacterium]|nr:sulfatase-like hydrolase/transferase [Acetobacteraceae bacterium]
MDPARRNVLFIVLDQWRADALGAAGNAQIETPALDRLARESTIFLSHFGQAAPCGPARAALLTGLYQHNNHVLRNGSPLERTIPTLGEAVRAAGYDPALFGYTDSTVDPRGRPAADPALFTYEGVMPGFTPELLLNEDALPWLAHLAEAGYDFASIEEALRPATGHLNLGAPRAARFESRHGRAAFITDAVLRYLSVRRKTHWFAHVCYIAPHPPFIAPAPFHTFHDAASMKPRHAAPDAESEGRQHPLLASLLARQKRARFFASDEGSEEGPVATLTDAECATLRATYYGMVSEVDDALGRIFARLEEWDLLEHTLVVVTGDHGEMLGDHRLLGKEGYFAEAVRVPLIIRVPGVRDGRRVKECTEAVDVMPTILEWLDAELPPRRDGHSLLGFCHGETHSAWRQTAHWEGDFRDFEPDGLPASLGLAPHECGFVVARSQRFQAVHFAALPPLLFDLACDPHCFENVADAPEYAAASLAATRALLSWRMAASSGPLSHLMATPRGLADLSGMNHALPFCRDPLSAEP